jgi:hypothetical protein
MMVVHRELATGRWFGLPLMEQLAHVGSEIERTMRWRSKGNTEYARRAFERALELLDLTIADAKHRSRLHELTRLREDESWGRYFHAFTHAAAIARGR